MTYQEICRRLEAAGVENPLWDAALLLEHFCGASRDTLGDAGKEYEGEALAAAVAARAERTPLQYLLGEWQFYRQIYRVTPDCLVPRSDTEILVEEAIRLLPPHARFADLCTGSGCIAVSVLAERPDTKGLGVDKFPRTLSLALENAERNGVGDRFEGVLCDLLSDVPTREGSFDAILSNPPYIAREVLPSLSPEVKKEPVAALDGGEDGLLFYRRILEIQKELLKPDGWILFEIGYDQAEAVVSLARAAGFAHARVIRDYGGQDRVVHLTR